ncbi:carboxypeptidase-like regulatory domain-containing protein [Winogradskyella immobilis]|uniref:Carboxypeptidase-like regulatory domain-containing protein n=1 Tax=Winogradskyella immobilis TaxID=2816852 RepID=A0ABS8EMG9_9FLAO|nr:carboxypeptidase-like regulatory domain-containing protein [Winogradskyella immobilis]MCC1484121.1 carboxypeptidase-like regulatory domain-containing protein [Winogradskyella immobilis]MCG0016213.1 carboxypeptidase-like regulatory domain-containing protein [Winogradskyella immobilis]
MIIKSQKNILTLISIAFVFLGYGQIELKSKVIDSVLQYPIENASVYIKNTTKGTVTNSDGKFQLLVPQTLAKDTLVISSIGYKSYKIPVEEFDNTVTIFLEEDIASLDEVVLVAEPRPTTGNAIVVKAIEKLELNLPDSSYIQKGFLRHKERNNLEFKWLIESAITVYDSGYASKSKDHLKINVDEVRKSYDLREIDSVLSYVSYSNQYLNNGRGKLKTINRNEVQTSDLIKSIRWNDNRVNGLQNLFQGKLNLLRNSKESKALFSEDLLNNHQFSLDTILVDNDRKIYKIKISESNDFVGLDTKGIFNEGYVANGWLYIYYDNYAIKKIEYELVAASEVQKERSKRLFGTQVNHKLVINYIEYEEKMYPNYIYYETPKLINTGLKSNKASDEEKARYNREERYYYTIQEILFSEIILDKAVIKTELYTKNWDVDIFSPKPYNEAFWKNYNVLLESEEDEQLIKDLSIRASLFKN